MVPGGFFLSDKFSQDVAGLWEGRLLKIVCGLVGVVTRFWGGFWGRSLGLLLGCFRAELKSPTPGSGGWIAGGLSADENFHGSPNAIPKSVDASLLRFGVSLLAVMRRYMCDFLAVLCGLLQR